MYRLHKENLTHWLSETADIFCEALVVRVPYQIPPSLKNHTYLAKCIKLSRTAIYSDTDS